jgi:hypothetical protein
MEVQYILDETVWEKFKKKRPLADVSGKVDLIKVTL